MNVLKLIVVCALMFFISIGLGMIILSLIKVQKEKVTGTYTAKALLLGTGVLLLMFGILVFVSLLLKESFLFSYKIARICLILLILFICLMSFFCKKTKSFLTERFSYLKKAFKEREAFREYMKMAAVFFAGWFLIVLAVFCHRPLLESRFDLPERVTTMDESNVLCGVNPLTHALEDTETKGILTCFAESFFPAFYLCFIRLFGISVRDMILCVIPVYVVCLCMCVYMEIAREVFQGDFRKIKYFLLLFTIFTLCGNKAYMNPSYGLLHYAYEETTWLSSVFLPCGFVLALRVINRFCNRKWKHKE